MYRRSWYNAGVIPALLTLLRCPETHEPLTGWDGATPDGELRAPCGRLYAIENFVPNLLPDALRVPDSSADRDSAEIAEMSAEMAARDSQVESYDGMLGLKLFTSVELPLTLSYLRPEPDHILLEAGCGTGRMTAAFAERAAGLVCVDFSRESLYSARKKLSPTLLAKTLFLQADLSRLPLASASFDRVGSFGVYEHLPTPEVRAAALAHLARVVKARESGGRLALSAYRWGPPLSWTAKKEGHHEPGHIYFIRKTLPELTNDISAHFEVGGATEALIYYHLLWARPRPAGSAKKG